MRQPHSQQPRRAPRQRRHAAFVACAGLGPQPTDLPPICTWDRPSAPEDSVPRRPPIASTVSAPTEPPNAASARLRAFDRSELDGSTATWTCWTAESPPGSVAVTVTVAAPIACGRIDNRPPPVTFAVATPGDDDSAT